MSAWGSASLLKRRAIEAAADSCGWLRRSSWAMARAAASSSLREAMVQRSVRIVTRKEIEFQGCRRVRVYMGDVIGLRLSCVGGVVGRALGNSWWTDGPSDTDTLTWPFHPPDA